MPAGMAMLGRSRISAGVGSRVRASAGSTLRVVCRQHVACMHRAAPLLLPGSPRISRFTTAPAMIYNTL